MCCVVLLGNVRRGGGRGLLRTLITVRWLVFCLQLLQQLLVDLTFVGSIGHLCSQAHVLSTVPTDSAC